MFITLPLNVCKGKRNIIPALNVSTMPQRHILHLIKHYVTMKTYGGVEV